MRKPPASTSRGESQARRLARSEEKNLELARTLQIVEDARTDLADQYDYAPFGAVTLDAKGCVRQINITAARMLGWKRSRLLAMPFFTHIEKPSLPTFFRHLRECQIRPGEVVGQVTLHPRSGPPIPVELRSVPVLDERGMTVYRTAVVEITERLRADRALRESEERYRELVELSPDGIFIVQQDVLVFGNTAAQRLCSLANPKDLVGRELLEWVHPSFHLALKEVFSAAAHEPLPLEVRWTRRDAAATEVEILARPFRHQGEPAALVVVRDISQRRNAERQVLAISERERTSFGQDVHDSLCQSLMGAAFLAAVLSGRLHKINPKFAAEADEIGRIVGECCDEARTLARGLCPVNMEGSGLVAALHGLTADATGRLRTHCTLECDDSLTLDDAAVATNVFRIAQEAVVNAVKHGQAKHIAIRFTAEEGRMTLWVHDDGKGISARPRRSGMGLQTMQYRATVIGGSLDVRRDSPRGTTVTCTFPITRATP